MRVERSFAFVDLCGFTGLTSTEGDDRATAVLAAFRATVRDIGSRWGVRVAKWLGDGAMLVGVEPEPLVCAVMEIERRVDEGGSPLPIRAGLARGRVILFEGDDYIGTPVNLAARLCDAAGPRQVLAVPAFEDCCAPWVSVSSPYTVGVPGFREPVELVTLARHPAGPSSVTDPVCGLTLAEEHAVSAVDAAGLSVWFCSTSCASAWADGQVRAAGG